MRAHPGNTAKRDKRCRNCMRKFAGLLPAGPLALAVACSPGIDVEDISGASDDELDRACEALEEAGYDIHEIDAARVGEGLWRWPPASTPSIPALSRRGNTARTVSLSSRTGDRSQSFAAVLKVN